MKTFAIVLAALLASTPAMARPVFHPQLGCIGGHHLVFIGGHPVWEPC